MLISVICYNLLTIFILALIGFIPAKLLQKKTQQTGLIFFAFSCLIFGYFLFESFLAIWFTRGVTVQWLNLIPFVLLLFFPDHTREKVGTRSELTLLILPIGLFSFSIWYFIKSYSYDFQNFNNYPFIDIISYASTSLALGISGAETSIAAGSIYYPDHFRFGLYHFTELWADVGFSKILSVTETYAICFVLPVFFLTVIGFGIAALGKELKIPTYALTAVGLAICFANGKLLLFDDVFLYNFLDLGGLKISLLFPVLVFLWLLRANQAMVFAFALLLPQINPLYFLLLGTVVGLYVLLNIRILKAKIPFILFVGYAIYAISFLFILILNNEGSEIFPENNFSVYQTVLQTFSYFREAVFNLGINYWGVFIVLSAMVISWNHILLILPFFIAKGSSKAIGILFPIENPLISVFEVLIFFLVLFLIDRKFKILNQNFYSIFWFYSCYAASPVLAMHIQDTSILNRFLHFSLVQYFH